MPMQLQTTPLEPNTIIINQILLSTYVADGQLVTGAQLSLQSANITNGVWTPLGNIQTVTIPDVEHLDEDLSSLAESVGLLMTQLIVLVDAINAIRKVL